MPDPIWIHFIQLGHVVGFKQKRRECKYCESQINDALRAAHTHFRNCDLVTSEQKKNYFGDSYEDENDCNISINIPDTSSPVVSTSASALVASTGTSTLIASTSSMSNKK
ncbi:26165_t:CDS:1, partial [Dentiscutata erythropus]